MKKICFSCPTVLLRRPIAEILGKLNSYNLSLIAPKDLFKGIIKIHYDKFKNVKIHFYNTISPPFISFEWPIPINPFFILKIIKILRNNDIIHMWVPFYLTHSIIGLLKSLFFKNKKLYLTIDTFPGYSIKLGRFIDFIFKIYYKTFGRILFSSIDKVILYSNSMKKFTNEIGISNNKVIIIPPGVNYQIRPKDKDIKKEFGIKENEKIILYIGLLNKRKNVSLIIDIAKEMKNMNIRFLLVGDGPEKKNLEKKIEKYKLNKNVILTGFRQDVHNFYHEANVFILPSKGEGIPGVLLESMIYGVPIVASNIFGVRDIIINNVNGFLCQTESIQDFSKKICILIKNKELRDKFINKSKDFIKMHFLWEKNLQLYVNLYN
ncbi:MAG: glycosyltransferase family 4 protein [Promethearchaeota archaeon]